MYMFLDVAANSWDLQLDRNAEFIENVFVSDTRKLENLYKMVVSP